MYLHTDFSALSFGYASTQPADDKASILAMCRRIAEAPCKFMAEGPKLKLPPVTFGSRWTCGNETRLHPHLGEEYASDCAINTCCHLCWGMCFVWATDCFSLKLILTYDGINPEILRLQMCLMCWDMDIIHRNDKFLIDADYWFCLAADLIREPDPDMFRSWTVNSV